MNKIKVLDYKKTNNLFCIAPPDPHHEFFEFLNGECVSVHYKRTPTPMIIKQSLRLSHQMLLF